MNPSNANLQYNDLIIRERHEDILALSAEMNQVQTVFRDLATMINDQGEMVEDIESIPPRKRLFMCKSWRSRAARS